MPSSSNVALVVAHPDDEALWFTSVLLEARTLVICFQDVPSRPNWTAGRRKALSKYPLSNMTNLGLTESETYLCADWPDVRESTYGLEVNRRKTSTTGYSSQAYRNNFDRLLAALPRLLDGMQTVYTHGPWGEYGHEEHVQVYRAVRALQLSLGFDLRFPNYASERSGPLCLRYLPLLSSRFLTLPTDPDLGNRLMAHYQERDCWTWFPDYALPPQETFLSLGLAKPASQAGSLIPLNMVRLYEPTPRPSLTTRVLRRLGREF